MPHALIALGTNLGNREENLRLAVEAIQQLPSSRILAVSRWLATQPVGGPAGQGEFLNGALRLVTELTASELLAGLQSIEDRLGRVRTERWGQRVLDLDLLLLGDEVIDTPRLQVPHPGLVFRRFVLEPAAQVAADMVHPRLGWSVGQLRAHLDESIPWVVVAGDSAELRAQFLARLLEASPVALQVAQRDDSALLASNQAGRSNPRSDTWQISQSETVLNWPESTPVPRLILALLPESAAGTSPEKSPCPLLGLRAGDVARDMAGAVAAAAAAISAMLPWPDPSG